jgi:hypothetical protein
MRAEYPTTCARFAPVVVKDLDGARPRDPRGRGTSERNARRDALAVVGQQRDVPSGLASHPRATRRVGQEAAAQRAELDAKARAQREKIEQETLNALRELTARVAEIERRLR